MTFLLLSILSLGLVAAILSILKTQNPDKIQIEKALPETECCGAHEVCKKNSLMTAASTSIEYFDDEELDIFKNIPPEQYTDDQANAFRDVFETLPEEEEVAAWIRSLHLRCIEIPNELKDEVLLIVGEQRINGLSVS